MNITSSLVKILIVGEFHINEEYGGIGKIFFVILNSCIPTKWAVSGLKVRGLHIQKMRKESFVIESMRNILWRIAFKGSKNGINMNMILCYMNPTSHRTLGQDMVGCSDASPPRLIPKKKLMAGT